MRLHARGQASPTRMMFLAGLIGCIVLAGDVREARAAGTLMGTIWQRGTGSGTAGATAIVDDGTTPQSTTTDGNGDYSFSLAAGTFLALVSISFFSASRRF